jgi:hypothetical protein
MCEEGKRSRVEQQRFSMGRIVYHASAVAQVMFGASWVRYELGWSQLGKAQSRAQRHFVRSSKSSAARLTTRQTSSSQAQSAQCCAA